PRLTSSGSVATLAALLLAGACASFVGVREHLALTQDQLAAVQAQDRKRAFEAGTQRALCLVNTTVDTQDHLRQGRTVCEETLGLYGVLERQDWQAHPDWQRLDAEDQRRLAEDARELLLLCAWAGVRTGGASKEALRGALNVLDRATAMS